jgi:hypothetical protein
MFSIPVSRQPQGSNIINVSKKTVIKKQQQTFSLSSITIIYSMTTGAATIWHCCARSHSWKHQKSCICKRLVSLTEAKHADGTYKDDTQHLQGRQQLSFSAASVG